ncbi:MAG: alpha/beta fold hydrolase [Chitinophagaceae bacterium]|nr:MAG: alpha/beta fold hydrolase [Chitinophagaceae bacterium]
MLENSVQYWAAAVPQKTAVTLVIPGLNVRPDAMEPMVQLLNSGGSDVYLVCLPGLQLNEGPANAADASAWQHQVKAAYRVAREAAAALSLPLYFLGYSLGALLGQSALLSPGEGARFEKQVLLAPAMALRRRCYLLKAFIQFGRPATLPSFTPKGYRVHPFLPLSFYRVLFAEEQKLWSAGPTNRPTLVLMDPADELVSLRKLQKQVQRFGLSRYKLVLLNKRRGLSGNYHHLILDEASMGRENWEKAKKEITAFLFA